MEGVKEILARVEDRMATERYLPGDEHDYLLGEADLRALKSFVIRVENMLRWAEKGGCTGGVVSAARELLPND